MELTIEDLYKFYPIVYMAHAHMGLIVTFDKSDNTTKVWKCIGDYKWKQVHWTQSIVALAYLNINELSYEADRTIMSYEKENNEKNL